MPFDSVPKISVLIGADSLATRRSGVGRMTLEIARAARVSAAVDQAELLMGDKLVGIDLIDSLDDPATELSCEPPRPIPWKVALGRVPGVQHLRQFKHSGLRRSVRRLAATHGGQMVYHEPNMIARPVSLPTVVTINDLSWHHEPSWHPADRLQWIHRNLPRTLRQAERFVAISEFTRDAVVRELGIAADRIDVVPLAPAQEFQPMSAGAAAAVLARFDLVDRSYVFSISTLEPRKNFDRLLTAHLQLPPALRQRAPLVIAGGKGWGEVLARPAADAAIRDGTVRLLGHVADADLIALCARAGVFAYVSLYEGFGLPVVEAMAAGTPVLASNTTAVGELAVGAALLVNPLDEAAITEGLRQLIEDPAYADELRQAGLARAAEYTWQRTIDTLVLSWRRALH
ncbi:glycosyltransferase family 1 protein [Acidisphaera sp. L21]|uniref:glycosyltransferase family 4 protein n=1 Tax=Acidisphaera sp. L21 TaxID=1641851 RepID=UPI00131CA2D1|nr:glycosyltransferase family 1 protein [Acidisphaera sp. L21]